jgi:hypothetical protein
MFPSFEQEMDNQSYASFTSAAIASAGSSLAAAVHICIGAHLSLHDLTCGRQQRVEPCHSTQAR